MAARTSGNRQREQTRGRVYRASIDEFRRVGLLAGAGAPPSVLDTLIGVFGDATSPDR